MKPTKFSIDHAIAVFVLVVCIVLGGYSSYRSLPREAAPDIAIPIVIVSTPYFGVSPADIETLLTQPIEKELKSLRGVKKMTSTSAESVSLVTVEFETDVDIEDALDKVREKVDKVKVDLPPDAEESEVIEVNASDFPILIANVSGDMDLARLKEVGESIKDDIEKVPGVLRVDISGGIEREIQVLVDPEKMRHFEVSSGQIIGVLQAENTNLPGGSLEIGSMKYLLRVPGEFEDLETIRNLVVKAPQGQQVLLKDVAEVRDSFKEPETYSRLNKWVTGPNGERTLVTQPSISLSIVKRAGENLIRIADESKGIIADYERRMSPGVEVQLLNDSSTFIRATVRDLENNIISGMLLVLGVLFFFMGGARNALMVAISVPLSMLITFITLSAMGITLNMVVLFSLILALGMLVDNAIVIVENIYRHASEGKTLTQAAFDGTDEVGWAVIASTATTVGAFFPMVFWPGVVGKFMGFLPKTVIITLIASLFVALIINPTVAAVLLKVKPGEASSEYEIPDNILYRMYRGTLEWSLNHKIIVMILAVGALFGSFAAFAKFNVGVEFFPSSTPEQFTVRVETADGTRLERTDDVVALLSDPMDGTVEEIPGLRPEEVEEVKAQLAESDTLIEAWVEDVGIKSGNAVGGGQAPHYGTISVDLFPAAEQEGDPLAFMDALRKLYLVIPGANVTIEKQEQGPPTGKAVNVEIIGDDLTEMARIAQMIKDEIRTIPGVIDLSDDLELSRPEIVVLVDRERAKLAKVSTYGIATTVRTAFNGTKATVFREGDEEFDITVQLPKQMRGKVENIRDLTVSNEDGKHIPLVEVAEVSIQSGTGSIRHKNQERVASVSANAASGYLPADLLREVQAKISNLQIPAGYEIRYAGENEDQEEAAAFLGNALMIAVFVIALILVTQFNSIVQPFIILASVLLSLIGVLLSLIVYQEPFGIVMSGIGIISLAGVVVNNSIVLIDYANKLRERGMKRREAVMTAGLVRFRPVLLTATTTILGLMPLVVGVSIDFVSQQIVTGGSSVDLWGPMARVVSFGLMVATVLTLVVVPVMYAGLDPLDRFTKRLFGIRDFTHQDGPDADEEDPDDEDDFSDEVVEDVSVEVEQMLADAETDAEDVDDADKAQTPPGTTGAVIALIAGLAGLLAFAAPDVSVAQEVPDAEVTADADAALDGEVDEEGFSTPEELLDTENTVMRAPVDLSALEVDSKRTLTLDQAKELVRTENFDVKIGMANIEIADTTVSKAFSTLYPSVSGSFNYTRYNQEVTFDFPDLESTFVENEFRLRSLEQAAQGGAYIPPPEIEQGPPGAPQVVRPLDDYNVALTVSYRVNPRAWPLLQQAYTNRELSELQVDAIREELEFAVTQTYYSMLQLKQAMRLRAEQVAADRTALEANQRRFEAGVLRKFELTRSQLRVAQSEQLLAQVRLSFIQTRLALAMLLQTEPDFDVAEIPPVKTMTSVEAYAKGAIERRATLSAARKGEELGDWAIEDVKYQYLPTLGLNFTTFRPRATAFAPGEFQWSLGVNFNWTIWDGGLREADMDEKEAQLVKTKLQRRQAEAQLLADLESAWTQYETSLAQLTIARDQRKLAAEAVDETSKAFVLGAATQLDVLTAEDQLRLAELSMLQEELNVELSVQRLKYLSGRTQ